MMTYSKKNRHLIIISGKQSDCQTCAKKLTNGLDVPLLDEPKKASQFLGQEFDAVVFNSFDSFDANAFGTVSGTIRAGGFLLLLKPINWPRNSLFLKRFDNLLKSSDSVFYVDPKKNQEALPLPNKKKFPIPFATTDQKNAVDAIINVVKGHRRRPLVITADRGRGKSASLGLAANNLLSEGYKKIIVCAPSRKTAAVIYQYAKADESQIKFYSPDELNKSNLKADLVLVDEAAAIPVPLLVSFLKRFSRIVFASTQHGYEGSGRGFSINFRKVLNEVTPEWKSCKLKAPIRWNDNDTLESFVFESLLLNAEPVDEKLVADAKLAECEYKLINKRQLLQNEKKLNIMFGLLVSAHYQTKPSDLQQLLDDEAVTLHTLQFKQRIIAIALLINEGGLDREASHQIFLGNRRIKGHLVAQSLAANVGIESAPLLKGERICRIAVHPSLQQQGYGSLLLKHVINNSRADYLSTSYGATVSLINFWKKMDFSAVYLGMKRDASSGTHSVLMLYPKTEDGNELKRAAHDRFSQHFPHLLSEPFRVLEADVALALLSKPSDETEFSLFEINELEAFALQKRGYENTIYPLWKLVSDRLSCAELSNIENEVLLRKVLQKQPWQELSASMSLSGKKEGLVLLRQAVGKLLA